MDISGNLGLTVHRGNLLENIHQLGRSTLGQLSSNLDLSKKVGLSLNGGNLLGLGGGSLWGSESNHNGKIQGTISGGGRGHQGHWNVNGEYAYESNSNDGHDVQNVGDGYSLSHQSGGHEGEFLKWKIYKLYTMHNVTRQGKS